MPVFCSIFYLVSWPPCLAVWTLLSRFAPIYLLSFGDGFFRSYEVALEMQGLQVICLRPPWKYGHENNSCGKPTKRNCLKAACLSLTRPGMLEHSKRWQVSVCNITYHVLQFDPSVRVSCIYGFYALVFSKITLTSTWKEVKKIIKEDPRCIKFSSSDRVRGFLSEIYC